MPSAKTLALIGCAFVIFIMLAYCIFLNLYINSTVADFNLKISSLSSDLNNAKSGLASSNSANLKLQGELSATKQTLQNTKAELDLKNLEANNLSKQLSETGSRLEQAKSDIEERQKKMDEIKGELGSLEENLSSSMSWFRQNALLPINFSPVVGAFEQRISEDCVYNGIVNLACINYLNERTVLQLQYKQDIDAGKADHLQSVAESIGRKGGDCEDFSLFFKATLNSLKSEGYDYEVEAWESGGDGGYRVWPIKDPNVQNYLYYPYARSRAIGNLKESYAYVVCYPVDSASGHCTVALSENRINSSSQLRLLNGAYVFEPQNGMFLGRIGSEFQICNPKNEYACRSTYGSIILVISDDNLYQVMGNKWLSYADFLEQAKALNSTAG